MFYAKSYISNAIRYLSLLPGFLLCSLRPFRMLTSAWARLPVLGDYGSRDIIASHITQLPCYQDMADSRKARNIIAQVEENKNTNNNFKERGFLPHLKEGVSTSSIR